MKKCEICNENEFSEQKDGVYICSECSSKWIVKRKRKRRVNYCAIKTVLILLAWYSGNHILLVLILPKTPESFWVNYILLPFGISLWAMIVEFAIGAGLYSAAKGLYDWFYPEVEA